MIELQSAVDSFPIWIALLWCFYPISIVLLIEIISNTINDDDDQDHGKMIPVLQPN